MGLAWVIFNLPADKFLALGDLDGRGGADAAATLWCNAGGVSWPELIAFYAPGPRLLGSVDLGDINLPGHTGGENAGVQQLRYDRGNVIAEWMTQNDGDPAAISSMDYTATLHWNGSKIVVSRLTATTERETVNRFLTALRNGDTPAAAQLTAPDVTAAAMNQFARYPEALINTAPVCHGVLDQLPPSAQGLSVSELMGRVDRICLIPTDHEAEHYIALGLKHSSFKQWQISALAII